MCDMHFKRNAIDPSLKRIITGDEKWTITLIEKDRRKEHDEPA